MAPNAGGLHQLGTRKQQEVVSSPGSNSPLKVSRDSHRIRKPPLPLPQVQYRPPIIIHTYSPKVIHTEPDDFMSLVQKLTGSSDTRLRLKKTPSSKNKDKSQTSVAKEKSEDVVGESSATTVANLERQGKSWISLINLLQSTVLSDNWVGSMLPRIQFFFLTFFLFFVVLISGSGNSVTGTSCGSPSSSEDSEAFLVSEPSCEGEVGKLKQSNSPRSPFDSSFEFDNVNESMMFSHFDPSAGNPFSQTVKAEPMFSFNESLNPFNFCAADFMHPVPKAAMPASLSRAAHQEMPGVPLGNQVVDHQLIHSSLPSNSSNFFSSHSTNLMGPAGLPDFSPSWSQPSFLDSFMNQAPYQRQRFSGGYALSPEVGSSTMVALDNIQAFMLT